MVAAAGRIRPLRTPPVMVAPPRFVHHQFGHYASWSDHLLPDIPRRKTHTDFRVSAAPGIQLSRYKVSIPAGEGYEGRSAHRDRGYRPALPGRTWEMALFEDALCPNAGR